MNPIPTMAYWGQLAIALGIEAAILVGAAEFLQRFTRSATVRRTIWQTAVVCLLLVTLVEISGLSQVVTCCRPLARVARKVEPRRHDAPANTSFTQPAPELPPRGALAQAPELSAAKLSVDKRGWWPGQVWFSGFALLIVRILLGRCLLWSSLCRSQPVVPNSLAAQIQNWSRQLGRRPPVRIVASRRLAGPIACGVWRPIIGLPERFLDQFAARQQAVILLHELAHLRARDPQWRLISDLAVALLWWHPAMWWLQRQLLHATEVAADEASLMIPHGPGTLAECLVEMGHQLRGTSGLAWLGIQGNGFRSSLGRRVARLLRMSNDSRPLHLSRRNWRRMAASIIPVLGLTLLAASWLAPKLAASDRTAARSPAESWQRSLLGITWALISSSAEQGHEVKRNTEMAKSDPATFPETMRPSSESGTPLENRLFRVDRPMLIQAIIDHSGKPDEAHSDWELVRDCLAAVGIQIHQPESVLLNERAGILFIRTTQAKLDSVQSALARSGTPVVMGTTTNSPPKIDQPASSQLFSRVYKVDPETFIQGLESTSRSFDLTLPELPPIAVHPQIIPLFFNSAAGTHFPTATRRTGRADIPEPRIAGEDISAGADAPENQSERTMSGRAFYYKDRSGLLLVRATMEELDAMEAVIMTLNATPPQVMIEAVFVEVPAGVDLETPMSLLRTNGTSVLTEPQFHALKSTLEQMNGVKQLPLPCVTTLSGRQTQIKQTQQKSVAVATGSPSITITGEEAIAVNTIETGPRLDVMPLVLANDAIRLTLAPDCSKFIGYDTTNSPAQPDVQLPAPRIVKWSTTNTVTIWSGQTVFCGGSAKVVSREGRNKMPVLGDIPMFGRLFRSETKPDPKSNFGVFVTATIIDPAGNPVHGNWDLPPPIKE